MSAFSGPSAEVMRLTVQYRAGPQGDANERAFAGRLLGEYELTKANWVAAERDAMIISLKKRIAPVPAGGPPPALSVDDPMLKEVAEEDRAIYAQAMADYRAGRPDDAWKKGEPLFMRYQDVYVVQDLRCKLALALSSLWEDARRECARLMEISRGKPSKKLK
jgi:hypothetical protein